MKVSIIIPIYNEAASCARLIEKVLAVPLPFERELIIVEGGSTDGTQEVLKQFEHFENVRLFTVTDHIGKGYKVRYGITWASGDIILIQDADLEYDPKDYPDLLQPFIKEKTDFVLGSRHMQKGSWKIREFSKAKWYERAQIVNLGDRALNAYFSLLYGTKLTDINTMYKVFRKCALDGITLKSNGFDLDMELLIKLLRKGYKPLEVPVSYKSRTKEQGKKLKIVRDGIRIFWAITKYRFVKL